MAFKLLDSARARWRALTARHLVALVRAGARFEKGEAGYRVRTRSAVRSSRRCLKCARREAYRAGWHPSAVIVG
jgi:hypothetical protein